MFFAIGRWRREIEAGIEDVDVSVDQDQEDIDQSNEVAQFGPGEDEDEWGPALAIATAEFGDVSVKQTGTLYAGDTGIDAQSEADAKAELAQVADQDNRNSQSATTAVTFTATRHLQRGRSLCRIGERRYRSWDRGRRG